MSEQRRDNEIDAFERQLISCVPQSSQLDRSALLFRAGQESMCASPRLSVQSTRLWQVAAALFALVSLGLSWQLYRADVQRAELTRLVEGIRSIPSTNKYPSAEDVNSKAPAETIRERITSPGAVAAEPQSSNEKQMLSRNHYLHSRQLALAIGLDALAASLASGSSQGTEQRSYRDLKESSLKF